MEKIKVNMFGLISKNIIDNKVLRIYDEVKLMIMWICVIRVWYFKWRWRVKYLFKLMVIILNNVEVVKKIIIVVKVE